MIKSTIRLYSKNVRIAYYHNKSKEIEVLLPLYKREKLWLYTVCKQFIMFRVRKSKN